MQKVSHPTLQLPMGFLVELKVSEILRVTTFDTICTSSFDTKHVHDTMVVFLIILGTRLREVRANQRMVMGSCALHLNTTHGGFLNNFRNYIV